MKRLHWVVAALGLAIAALFLPANAQDTDVLAAHLFGENVTGGGGGAGEEAYGDFNALADGKNGQLCYYLEVAGVGDVTGAHIHDGKTGRNGEALVTLELAEMDERCVVVAKEMVAAMIRRPSSYYVDIHTAKHPNGALRGQLED